MLLICRTSVDHFIVAVHAEYCSNDLINCGYDIFRAAMKWASLLLVAFICFARSPANATDYLFHVSCQDKSRVAEWNTGSVDPGKEYLRVATGTKFPGCSVSDYVEARDSSLPRDRFSHEGGVIAGIPFIGGIICGLFGC
ncbi:hypothetical protein [Bradyrhizobium sp. LA7.1]|uniref:hypothetical protein n=1 Tax=Bradyrhizobium sp. LA7.1 TaxID=3156324 RepID=UPI00339B588F